MEAKGEISMRMVHCEDCGKRYDYDVDGLRHSRSGQGGSSGNWEKISVRQRWPWAGC